ncbi:MAG: NAD(P)H-hydrate dehydratase [Prolixibacteraceae bacterium]|nr:NAD(P)H-hydrate dehydratase [Prolixibacteraceae bacterium]
MKLFKTSDIAIIDQYTIEHEPIGDIDLMERAAQTIVHYLVYETDFSGKVLVFCGPGNNGGDGLAVARLLAEQGERFRIQVCLYSGGRPLSNSALINLKRLEIQGKSTLVLLDPSAPLPEIDPEAIVIDALFGSGLNRPLDGYPALLVKHLNQSGAEILSIDIPSGLMGEDNRNNQTEHIIRATKTITFQFPKLSFMFPENELFIGDWSIADIGLHPEIMEILPSPYHLIEDADVSGLMKTRTKFSHKGTYGHALLIAGSYGKMGAAVLASKACLRSGVGLLTTHVPHSAYPIIQTAVPEAMVCIDESDLMFTSVPHLEQYSAIGIGPAIGTKVNSQRALQSLLSSVSQAMVLDADALNILGEHREWLEHLPEYSILTPHPKEFERLTRQASGGYDRLQLAIDFASKYKIVLIVKGAHTMIVAPDGQVWFNTTGNPGMATAGSGDVLTGILLGLLAQGYPPLDAARIGVFGHGLSGDLAVNLQGMEALIASDIIENLGEAFRIMHK